MHVPLTRALRFAFLLFTAVPAAAPSSAQVSAEHQLKAAFIHNFIRFVEWPAPEPGEKIRVAVVGNEAVVKTVRDWLSGRVVGDRTIVVTRAVVPSDGARADVLYITGNDESLARRYVSAAAGRPVLTVTESDRFLQIGSLVNFFVADDTVRFAVNVSVLERSPLKLSSQMLQYASLVRTELP